MLLKVTLITQVSTYQDITCVGSAKSWLRTSREWIEIVGSRQLPRHSGPGAVTAISTPPSHSQPSVHRELDVDWFVLPTPHFTENLNFDIVTVVTLVTHKSCLTSFDKKKRNKIREQKMPRTFGRNMKMKKITHLRILSSLFTSDCSRD